LDRVLTSEIWREVERRARKAESRKAAVAYVTKDLIGLRAGDVLITDASTRAIRSGQTDAPLLKKLHENGVTIYSHEGLHSKVILLGRYAVVGSANMSGSGMTEASVLTDNPTVTSGIASFIAQLSRPRNKLTKNRIDDLAKIKVIRSKWHNPRGRSKVKKVRRLGNTTWIIGVNNLVRDPPRKEQQYIDRATRNLNDRFGTENEDYGWIRWGKRSRFSKECREGDTLIEICNQKGSGRRSVIRRLPVLRKRNEPNYIRFYIGDPQRDSDQITWSRFQRILKKAEYPKQVRPYSVQPLGSEMAETIDRKWARVR
jgi:hypothetical protein